MMLAHRIIPVMLQRGSTLVKGERFQSWRSVGHAQQAVAIHQARGVDELIYLDIGATPEGRGPDFETVRRLTEKCFMPITVGGGVRSIADARGLLAAGADKVAIRTAGPGVIADCANVMGCQAIVAAMDVWNMDNMVLTAPSHGPCHPKLLDIAARHAEKLADAGAGEILLTRCEYEGMQQGYDLGLIERVASTVNIPIIAHGGCGSYEHMAEAIRAGASAVAAGSLFQFTDATPRGAAEYLAAQGIEVRL